MGSSNSKTSRTLLLPCNNREWFWSVEHCQLYLVQYNQYNLHFPEFKICFDFSSVYLKGVPTHTVLIRALEPLVIFQYARHHCAFRLTSWIMHAPQQKTLSFCFAFSMVPRGNWISIFSDILKVYTRVLICMDLTMPSVSGINWNLPDAHRTFSIRKMSSNLSQRHIEDGIHGCLITLHYGRLLISPPFHLIGGLKTLGLKKL